MEVSSIQSTQPNISTSCISNSFLFQQLLHRTSLDQVSLRVAPEGTAADEPGTVLPNGAGRQWANDIARLILGRRMRVETLGQKRAAEVDTSFLYGQSLWNAVPWQFAQIDPRNPQTKGCGEIVDNSYNKR